MWQEIIVGLCVLAATVFLIRQWLWPTRKNTSCGGCNGCDKTSKSSCANPAGQDDISSPARK
jgi:hypothetical protein